MKNEARDQLARFAILILTDPEHGEHGGDLMDPDLMDYAIDTGILVESPEPCPPEASCEECSDGNRCLRYTPAVQALIDEEVRRG